LLFLDWEARRWQLLSSGNDLFAKFAFSRAVTAPAKAKSNPLDRCPSERTLLGKVSASAILLFVALLRHQYIQKDSRSS